MQKRIDEIVEILKNKDLQNRINQLAEIYSGKKILAYGAGLMAEFVLDEYDISKLDIIGFVDSKYLYKKEDFKGYKSYSPDEIEEINPDIILVFTYYDNVIKTFINTYYPEIKNIPTIPLVKKGFFEKLLGKV